MICSKKEEERFMVLYGGVLNGDLILFGDGIVSVGGMVMF